MELKKLTLVETITLRNKYIIHIMLIYLILNLKLHCVINKIKYLFYIKGIWLNQKN